MGRNKLKLNVECNQDNGRLALYMYRPRIFAQTYVHDSERQVNAKQCAVLGWVRGVHVIYPKKTNQGFAHVQKSIGADSSNSPSEQNPKLYDAIGKLNGRRKLWSSIHNPIAAVEIRRARGAGPRAIARLVTRRRRISVRTGIAIFRRVYAMKRT